MCSQCGGNNINNKEAPNNVQLIQDVISIKSYLQKLRRILHDHEDDATPMIISEEQLKSPPPITTTILDNKISRENGKNKTSEDEINDLKKQLALLTQQNIEKDRKIASLQRQLDCKTLVTSPLRENNNRLIDRLEPAKKNGATQTERVKVMSASSDSGSGYGSSNRSHSSSPAGSVNGEYRSNTAERIRLRRSRTPVSARTPPPSAVFMSPAPSWSSSSNSSTTTTTPVYKCSEDGTLRIPIRSTSAKPKTTTGYYTTSNKPFL